MGFNSGFKGLSASAGRYVDCTNMHSMNNITNDNGVSAFLHNFCAVLYCHLCHVLILLFHIISNTVGFQGMKSNE